MLPWTHGVFSGGCQVEIRIHQASHESPLYFACLDRVNRYELCKHFGSRPLMLNGNELDGFLCLLCGYIPSRKLGRHPVNAMPTLTWCAMARIPSDRPTEKMPRKMRPARLALDGSACRMTACASSDSVLWLSTGLGSPAMICGFIPRLFTALGIL